MRWMLTCAVGVVAVFGGAARADVLSHWRFDETSGVVASDSAGTVSGTLSGSAHFVAGGVSGGAISIAQATNDFVSMGDVFQFDGNDSFSIQVWVKTAPGQQGAMFPISSHLTTIAHGYLISINEGAGYGRPNNAYFYTGDFPAQEAISTSTVNDGQWHQIVGVYSPSSGPVIYVDGAPREATGSQGYFSPGDAPFMVGGLRIYPGVLQGYYTGLIDDVQIYCGALTDAQVQFLFDHPGQEIARCPANWNRDCSVNSQDFFDFLTSFFAAQADFNHDGSTNSQDFFDFVSSFFTGC